MRSVPMLRAVWEGLRGRFGAEKMSEGGRKPKDAVKVTVVFSADGGRVYLDDVIVSESDIPRAHGSEGWVSMWTEWGANTTLMCGRVQESYKGDLLISIANESIPGFTGMDRMGRKPLQKERYPGERYIWELRGAQERATQAVMEEEMPAEGENEEDEPRPKKWGVRESPANYAMNKERRKRSDADGAAARRGGGA